MPKQIIETTLPLPPAYRRRDFLDFHSRDAQCVAEKTTRSSLNKGILWNSLPARLRLVFRRDTVTAGLSADGSREEIARLNERGADILVPTVRRMLGLLQPVEAFEAAYAAHPQLGKVVAANSGLRVMQTVFPFEALCWAIIGQLVSVQAAVSIRRRFILAAAIRHSSGIMCFPDAEHVAAMPMETLRAAGLSGIKASSLLELSRAVARGDIPLDQWQEKLQNDEMRADAIRERLKAIRGIGDWTVSYALLRGFGHLDGSLHGDVAVRRNLARLLQSEEKITEKQAEHWLAAHSPWRALVAAHLWGMQSHAGF